MFWLGIQGENLIGPFRIEGTVNSQTYCDLLKRRLNNLSQIQQSNTIIFMHNNAPSHASHFTKELLKLNKFGRSKLLELPRRQSHRKSFFCTEMKTL